MVDQERPDPQFDAMTARLLRREALRRAAEEMNTTSGPGLEGVLARISAEVTAGRAATVAGRPTVTLRIRCAADGSAETLKRSKPQPPADAGPRRVQRITVLTASLTHFSRLYCSTHVRVS